MDAVISGRAGTALLIDGISMFSFDVDDLDTHVPRQQSDLPFLFGDASDIQLLENVDCDHARRLLELAYNGACALDLALILLDSERSAEVREEAAEDLEGLFTDAQIIEHLESLLYARPLPEAADVTGAIERSDRVGAKTIVAVMQSLLERQTRIREVSQVWDATPSIIFGGEEPKAEFQREAIRECLFRGLVIASVDGGVEGFLVGALRKPSIQALPENRDVLKRWAAKFRSKVVTSATLDIQEPNETEIFKDKGRKRRHRSRDRIKVLDNVESQKRRIIEIIKRHEFRRFHSLIDELVEYHLTNDGPEFAVKSLCDLAIEAKLLGNHRLQLELMERSIYLQPGDGWSWIQYADALLRNGRPLQALKAYNEAAAFVGGAVVKSGRAETLRALGRPNEALDAYDTVIAEHPEDVVAKNGRAGTLRALGRFLEALDAYDAVIAEHPENVVARNGRSCILAALHRYEEALHDLPDKDPVTQGDWIGYHVRGMVFLRTGRLAEALRVFEEGIIGCPWPSQKEFFKAALGMAWLRQHEFSKANEALQGVTSPILQPEADILLIHSYGEAGQTELAGAVYERLRKDPQFISEKLTEELHRRYVLREGAGQDDEWVFDREVNLLLFASNQNVVSSALSYSITFDSRLGTDFDSRNS